MRAYGGGHRAGSSDPRATVLEPVTIGMSPHPVILPLVVMAALEPAIQDN
jgi:hypothetical protein